MPVSVDWIEPKISIDLDGCSKHNAPLNFHCACNFLHYQIYMYESIGEDHDHILLNT